MPDHCYASTSLISCARQGSILCTTILTCVIPLSTIIDINSVTKHSFMMTCNENA